MSRIAVAVLGLVLVAACGPTNGTARPTSTSAGTAVAATASGPAPTTSASPIDSIGPTPTDGRIAYVVGSNGASELHVIEPDGTNDISCGPGSAPTWSWDGHQLLLAGAPHPTADGASFPDVLVAAPDCVDATRIVIEATAPHPAPDGTRLTFGRGVIDTGDAWIANADGSAQRRLAAGTSPTWSPDGAWLLFQPDTGVFELGLVRPDGSDLHSLGRGGSPAWTPDGRIVYLRSDVPAATTTVRVIALDGTATDLFTAPGDLASPAMLVDGTVVFLLDGDVWRLDPGSPEPVRLSEGLQAASALSPSPDGQRLAVAAGGSLPGLAVVSLDGGWARIAPGLVTDVAWQPMVAGD